MKDVSHETGAVGIQESPNQLHHEPSIKERIRRTLHFKRALVLVWESGPRYVISSGLLLVVQGLLPLVNLYLIKLVVDEVTLCVSEPDGGGSFSHVALLICVMGAIHLVTAICRTVASLVSEAQSVAVTDHVQDILHSKSVEVDLEYYENSQYYDTLHRAQREAPYRPTRIVSSFISLFQSGISLLAVAGLLFAFHWAVALVLFVAAAPGLIVRIRHARRMYQWQRKRTPMERYAHYYHYLLTHNANAKEIRLFDLGAHFKNRFRDLRRKLRVEWLKLARRRSLNDSVTQVSFTLALFGSYAFIAYRAVQAEITLGDLVMFFQAVQRGQSYVQQALGSLAGLYEHNLFLSDLSEFLNLAPRVKERERPAAVPKALETGIAVDHVDFSYPTGTREVLHDISLNIRPGEHVAFVGQNGSGKTTLVKLLCRLYDPTKGRILLDNIDLRDFSIPMLRREIGVIFQDFVGYHLPASENIRLGNIDLDGAEQEAIRAAARRSGAHAVIESLHKGYDTILGKWFAEGEELSIGEWQKVALARAYLRDAQIVILDEPTSSMDARAEFEVFKKFTELSIDRTTILISHRLSTVRMADRILVLDEGRIVEGGSHDELIGRGGKYKELFETQASNYR